MNEKEKNNDKFILEYPENYEEICQIALKRLDKDYNNIMNSKTITENKEEKEINEEEEENEEESRNYVQLEEEEDDSNNFKREEEDYKEKETIKEEKPKEEVTAKKEIVIKDPNRIKQMLSKVKFPAPKWGESLSDKDFIDKVKNICFNDNSSK